MTAKPKQRADQCLLDAGWAQTRAQAQRLIRAGQVRMGQERLDKPGRMIHPDTPLTLEQGERFVSRGGEKLEAAFAAFEPGVHDRICLDVGASTGGFTDCLLQHGARRVYALDVGHGQLHWKLRNDPRVIVKERYNARYLRAEDLPETPGFAAIDVSFISLRLILPPLVAVLAAGGELVTLIKPQFEAGRHQVEKGGVVRDEHIRHEVVAAIRLFCQEELRLTGRGIVESPLRGPAGNVEYLAHWVKS